ncbi:MAG: peptidoglycan editing factor PgeF [Trueperaceae bacterium]|nr:MAG: peptidoglycan editing factor PgeF [Trueperaceae bacterium]
MTADHLGVVHGFTTRAGGESRAPFSGLNLGLSTGDDPEVVKINRERLLASLGISFHQVCALHQVHGADVIEGRPSWFELEADGVVTDDPALLLVITTADCFPLLYHDPIKGVVGAVHAGWRGTVQCIAAEAVHTMQRLYGSEPEDIRVAIGPGIGGDCYQVGAEVEAAFKSAGFPSVSRPDREGRFLLDLEVANRYVLSRAGVLENHIQTVGGCTHCDEQQFYSHRRDAGRTGRHWAVVSLKPQPPRSERNSYETPS